MTLSESTALDSFDFLEGVDDYRRFSQMSQISEGKLYVSISCTYMYMYTCMYMYSVVPVSTNVLVCVYCTCMHAMHIICMLCLYISQLCMYIVHVHVYI